MPIKKQPKTPTALQLLQQKKKILDIKEKLAKEEWRLTMLLYDIPVNSRISKKVVIANHVFQVTAFNPSSGSPSCEVARIGTLEELKDLVCT